MALPPTQNVVTALRHLGAEHPLFQRHTPWWSLESLANTLVAFINFLTEERDHLLQTGLSCRVFRESEWLYRLAGRSYDTRCTGSPYTADELRPEGASPDVPYTWIRYEPRQPSGPLFDSGNHLDEYFLR